MSNENHVGPAPVAGPARPQFFAEPGQDMLWDVVIALTNELSATRARLDAVERLLAERKILAPGTVDGWIPDADAAKARTLEAQAYTQRIFGTLAA